MPTAMLKRLPAALAFLLVGTGMAMQEPTPDLRPNVLLIVVDTLRADYIGAYGFPAGASPNIDALAARSVVFDKAIAACSYTAPSVATIMTGRYPRHHSIGYSNGRLR
jgi:arylsulfatase A-like enzyme